MFYALSKILLFLFQPSSIVTVLIAGGVAMQWSRFHNAGRCLALAGTLLMLVLGFSPIGGALILPLEERFPRPALEDKAAITGIIILRRGRSQRHVAQ